jgi:hypothetical protein
MDAAPPMSPPKGKLKARWALQYSTHVSRRQRKSSCPRGAERTLPLAHHCQNHFFLINLSRNPTTHQRARIAIPRPSRPHDHHKHVSRQPRPRLLTPAKRLARPPIPASTSLSPSCCRSKVSSRKSSSAAHHRPPPASLPACATMAK